MPKSQRKGAGCGVVFNLLAAALVGLSCLSGVVYAALFVNPQLNPIEALRPPTEVAAAGLPTAIPTAVPNPTAAPATNTPAVPTLPPAYTPTKTATITNTPLPRATATDTETPTAVPPTRTWTPTKTATPSPTATGPTLTPSRTKSPYQYTLQSGSPAYVSNIANTNGCQWFGLSGQVFDLQNRGVVGLTMHVEGNGVNYDAFTGSAPRYGPSGWEAPLGNAPVASTNTYKIQLRNGTGQPLSETVVLDTFNDCGKNQIIINFIQNH